MKRHLAVFAVVALSIAVVPVSRAQGSDMKDMDMGKDTKSASGKKKSQAPAHKASGSVTQVDQPSGKVSIAHGAVQSLKWPAMTMTFRVKDKGLFGKLLLGKKVDFEFVQQGSDYVITSVR